jgi:nucleotide-binding universal stress UspA family protein
VPGHPAHELVRIAQERRADLIVVGHTGHAALRSVLLGGVSEHVIRHAPCSVLVTR